MNNDLATLGRTPKSSEDDRETVWRLPPSIEALAADGCPDFIPELVAVFTASGKSQLENARSAISRGDFTALRKEMHKLRGGSRQMGAETVASICQEIELQSSESTASEYYAQLARLVTAFHSVTEAMAAFIGGYAESDQPAPVPVGSLESTKAQNQRLAVSNRFPAWGALRHTTP